MGHRFDNPKWTNLGPAQKTKLGRHPKLPLMLARASVVRAKLAYAKIVEAWLHLPLIVFAFAWLTGPAQATVITIDVDYIERDLNIVCQPCGPSTITFNFDDASHLINWTFDWYGFAGLAHDAYAGAIANGADLFDLAENDPAGLDVWLIDHPNGVVFSRFDNNSGPGIFDSDWTVSLYNFGNLQTTRHDLLQVGASNGSWRTDDSEDSSYYQAYFTVTGVGEEGPPPSTVPEPGTLGLFLAAAAVGLGAKRWPRHRTGNAEKMNKIGCADFRGYAVGRSEAHESAVRRGLRRGA